MSFNVGDRVRVTDVGRKTTGTTVRGGMVVVGRTLAAGGDIYGVLAPGAKEVIYFNPWELTRDTPAPAAKPSFEDKVNTTFSEARDLMIRKHADYGPGNIMATPGGPLNGLAVRLSDKMARLTHLLSTGADPQNEAIVDTFRDILGYGAIGVMVCEGRWPGSGGKDGN